MAQKPTKVNGTVRDAHTKEPLAFVNVYFQNSNVGTTTDLDGKFSLNTRWATDSLQASFIGYELGTQAVQNGIKQQIDFDLVSTTLNLEAVTVKAKKQKYSKKNNPAVELIRKVMRNKKRNRLEGQDFYSYKKYEKVELDVNNITEKFQKRRIFNNFQFIFDYVDTSEINGKPYLPVFLREINSTVYYRRSPKTEKEHRHAIKFTEFDETVDEGSISDVIDLLYQDVDIYDNTIQLLDQQFVSPVAPIAINFYRFYIIDTLDFKGQSVVNLAFIPRNKQNFGFTGNLYISNDDRYSIRRVDMGIIGGINLNFVRDMRVLQEFEIMGDAFVLNKDQVVIDYALSKNGIGFFGTRSVIYDDYDFDPPPDPSVFGGFEDVILAKDAYKKTDEYWETNRLEELSTNEAELYEMIDSLRNLPAYKRLVYIVRVLTTGFVPVGPIDFGPLPVMASFNDVEGFRLRFGGETNFNLSKRFFVEGYGAYGFKDDAFKYAVGATYSFNEDFKENPRHFISTSFQRETSFPGQELQFVQEDNFLLSFKRGDTDKMLFSDSYRVDYVKEGQTLDVGLHFERKKRRPYGTLEFNVRGADQIIEVPHVTTSELGFTIRFAPNEQFVQGRQYRTPIINEHPIYTLRYAGGIKDLFGGEYDYHRLQLGFFKRFNWSVFGHTNLELEAGKVWGDLPFVLLHLPRANQTYAYQIRSYNMMNFLEFVNDEFVSLNMQHFFNGFIFNRIPLFKKLKFREVVTFKMLYGRLTDRNNPAITPGLIELPVDADGNSTTFTLEDGPYIEGSFGVLNILRFLRVDFVKRFTHLDNPNVPSLWGVKGLGIRARIRVEF